MERDRRQNTRGGERWCQGDPWVWDFHTSDGPSSESQCGVWQADPPGVPDLLCAAGIREVEIGAARGAGGAPESPVHCPDAETGEVRPGGVGTGLPGQLSATQNTRSAA